MYRRILVGIGSVFVSGELDSVESRPSTALRAVLRTWDLDLHNSREKSIISRTLYVVIGVTLVYAV